MAKYHYGKTYRSTVAKNKNSASQLSGSGGYELVSSQLLRTRPWVRFMSVMMILAVIATVVVGAVAEASQETGSQVGMKLAYIVLTGLGFFPACCLWSYASRITCFVKQPSDETLSAALASQRLYWFFAGVCGILSVCYYCVGLLISLAFSGPETWFSFF